MSTLPDVVTRRSEGWLTVSVRGPDARAFVHRLSTADTENLEAGQTRLTAFVDKRGRLRAVTLARGDTDGLTLLGPGTAATLVDWLDTFHFTEDLELVVPEPQSALELVGLEALPADLALPELTEWRWLDTGPDGASPWLVVVGADAALGQLAEACEGRGWRNDDEEVERLRIAAGVPGPEEIHDQHNPLELALHDAISWDKGCYIGQEVISRIDNYDKQSRHLVGLRLDDDTEQDGDGLAGGMELVDDAGKAIGRVTSAVPGRSGVMGLGLVRGREPIGLSLLAKGEDRLVKVETVARPAAQAPHD